MDKGHLKTPLIQIKIFIFQFFFSLRREIFLPFHCNNQAAFTIRKQNISGCSCSLFFKKGIPTADVRSVFPCPPSAKSSVRNFVPSWDEVKSVRKPCRFITSSFILQEKAHSDDRILLSILSVLAWAVFPDGMTAMTGMTGILGCPAAVIPYGRTPYKHKCRHGVSSPFFGS